MADFLSGRWLPAVRSTVRPSTFASYEAHVRLHIGPHLAGTPLREISGEVLNDLYAELLATGRHDGSGGLSPATVRRVHATIHRALRDAARWGYLTENPADRADPPRLRGDVGRGMKTWSPDELGRFLTSVRSDPLEPLWHVLAMTGMRRGEALGLRWCDIDLEGAELAVRQTVVWVSRQILISSPKTARGRRVVALDSGTVAVLRRWHRSLGSHVHSDALVFSRNGGKPLDPTKVTRRFARLVSSSGLPRIRLHDLRHTHATIALQAGIHPKIVSERLGHSTIAFTLDVYSHAVPHMQAEAAEQVAALIPNQDSGGSQALDRQRRSKDQTEGAREARADRSP